MKNYFIVFTVLMLAAGIGTMFILPLAWQPEPELDLRIGLGSALFSLFFGLALLFQLFMLVFRSGEKRSVEAITHEKDESHRQFLRRLDHELKNPLTGLQAALTNLRETRGPSDTAAAVDNASQAATRLGRILRDLRKLSELDASMLEHRPVNLEELVTEMVAAAGSLPAYRERKIDVMISKVPALPAISGDRDMLGLAVYNLLDNALKYTRPPEPVEVRVREDGRALFIEVADGGQGILAQEQERIFDDLYRGENARETEGSGLGLALARRIVHLHAGEISLRSRPAQSRGTVFTIRLPIS